MNVRLKKNWGVSCGIIWDDRYRIISYSIMAKMVTKVADGSQQNIAYERMNHWICEVMQDSVLMGSENQAISAFQATGQQVIVIPGEPIDQFIGMMLYCKLNAVAEQRLQITELLISSDLGDRVVYAHGSDEALDQFAEPGWWHDAGPGCAGPARPRQGKVINLARSAEWHDLGLAWDRDPADRPSAVVFADFPRHEDQ